VKELRGKGRGMKVIGVGLGKDKSLVIQGKVESGRLSMQRLIKVIE